MKLFFALFLLIVGAIFFYLGIQGVTDAKASPNWPSVDGTVTSSAIKESRQRSAADRIPIRRTMYKTDISYSYSVDGQPLTGEMVSFGESLTRTKAPVAAVVDKYPAGAKVEVFYKPSNPGIAVLETGLNSKAMLLPVFGGMMLIFGIVAFRSMRKSRRA